MIPVFRPSYDEREVEAVKEVLESGWSGQGLKVQEFEEKFGKYVGGKAVAVNSGTAALHLSLLALGVGEGDEVLVPTMSFVSTANAVSYCGAKVVFVDVGEDLNIDVEDAERKVTKKAKAIVPVHFGGKVADMLGLYSLASVKELMIVEDAAHACGSQTMFFDKKYRVGGIPPTDITCFSFHAVKNLSCGDGGMISLSDATNGMEDKLKRLRWCGIDKSTWEREGKSKYAWYYEVHELGYKCHMNDITAAIGLVQLDKLKWANRRRRRISLIYQEELRNETWLKMPTHKDINESSCHNFVIRTEERDALNEFLLEKGISTGVHYQPIHLLHLYRDDSNKCPNAERIWHTLLSLPIFPGLTEGELDYIIRCIKNFGRKHA